MVKFGGRWFFKRKNYWNENKSFEDFFRGIQKGEGEMNIYFIQCNILVRGNLFFWKQRNFSCNCRAISRDFLCMYSYDGLLV